MKSAQTGHSIDRKILFPLCTLHRPLLYLLFMRTPTQAPRLQPASHFRRQYAELPGPRLIPPYVLKPDPHTFLLSLRPRTIHHQP